MTIDKKKLFTTDNLIAAGVILLLIAWFPLMKKFGLDSKPAPAPVAQPAIPMAAQPGAPAPFVSPIASPVVTPLNVAAPVAGETVMLSTPEFEAAIDWKNGFVSSVTLRKHTQPDRKTPITLDCAQYPLAWLHTASGSLGGEAKLITNSAGRVVTERTLVDRNLVMRQEWAVSPDMPYKLDCKITIVNKGTAAVQVSDLVLGGGAIMPMLEELQGGFGMPATDAVDVAFTDTERSTVFNAGDIREIAGDASKNADYATKQVRWSAVHSKYFVLFVGAAGKELTGVSMHATEIQASADGKTPKHDRLGSNLLVAPTIVAPGAEHCLAFSVYAGPKEYTLLRKLNGGVESILQMDLFFWGNFDWMGKISRMVLNGMIQVKTAIGPVWAYGLAIILITLLVKLLFWPLTHFSTVSMKRMSSVQPLVKEINEKYKDNTQLKQQKVMELYREHKINPLMGCLPMLLQIPVFFALYNVFRCSIELRHANFLWVHDLSQPDTLAFLPYADVVPIRPLAILTGVTMFIQQKITPSSMDPTQAKMMMFMTLFFAFIFYSMPSGLTLYWTVNQAIGIVQTIITYKLVKDIHLPHLHHHDAKKA